MHTPTVDAPGRPDVRPEDDTDLLPQSRSLSRSDDGGSGRNGTISPPRTAGRRWSRSHTAIDRHAPQAALLDTSLAVSATGRALHPVALGRLVQRQPYFFCPDFLFFPDPRA